MQFFLTLKDRLVHIISCCDRDDEPAKAIEIVSRFDTRDLSCRLTMPQGYPTDFRKMDISIPGLSEEEYGHLCQ
jgi:hypothetical protein